VFIASSGKPDKIMFKFFNNTAKNSRFWWRLVSFWTVAVYAAVIFNFYRNGLYDKELDALLVIYIAMLAIYASDKEFERWHDHHSGRHPGEVFVFFWTILIMAIGACQFIFNKPGGLTSDVVAAYIAVLSVLAVTRRSRAIYYQRRRRQKE